MLVDGEARLDQHNRSISSKVQQVERHRCFEHMIVITSCVDGDRVHSHEDLGSMQGTTVNQVQMIRL